MSWQAIHPIIYFISVLPPKGLCFCALKEEEGGAEAQDESVSPAHWRSKEGEDEEEEWSRYFATCGHVELAIGSASFSAANDKGAHVEWWH